MQQLWLNLQDTLSSLHIPSIRWTDLVEIAVIAIVIYHLMVWFKSSRAWARVCVCALGMERLLGREGRAPQG